MSEEGVQASAHSLAEVVATMADIMGSSEDARDLLSLMHDKPRHWTLTSHGVLRDADAAVARRAAERVAAGEPMQYAAGRAAFRHLTLNVDQRVLIPRPETEVLVDIVLGLTKEGEGGTAVDVGTGSGAIAIALASEGNFARVIGTDISADALAVARTNGERAGTSCQATLEFRQGSLLGPVPERGLRAVVSNPPYISFEEAEALPALVRDWEPSVALFSGANGLATTAELIREAGAALAPGGVLAIEVDVRRASTVAELAATHPAYEDVRVLLDLTGRERFVVARRREE